MQPRYGAEGSFLKVTSSKRYYPAPDQIRDAYFWGNTWKGAPVEPTVEPNGWIPVHIQENRDFYRGERPGYTPYDYPHPLTVVPDPAPAAPTNLHVISG